MHVVFVHTHTVQYVCMCTLIAWVSLCVCVLRNGVGMVVVATNGTQLCETRQLCPHVKMWRDQLKWAPVSWFLWAEELSPSEETGVKQCLRAVPQSLRGSNLTWWFTCPITCNLDNFAQTVKTILIPKTSVLGPDHGEDGVMLHTPVTLSEGTHYDKCT